MSIFNQMVDRYSIITKDDERNAVHEVMQQIALAGLYRGNFFDKAAFYGGTCLRIFHKLQRFSEDMDFSLLKSDPNFNIENYFSAITNEFSAYGKDIFITKKEKNLNSTIESAFLKDKTEIYTISFNTEKQIKIKLEVDIDPPLGFQTESKLLLYPFSFMTSCYVLSDLFAGKMHAFLFRKWKKRVKGRDWYDFEWYIRNGVELNLNHFKNRALQSGNIDSKNLSENEFVEIVKSKIINTDLKQVKDDVLPFIKNRKEIEIWSQEYFLQLLEMLKFK